MGPAAADPLDFAESQKESSTAVGPSDNVRPIRILTLPITHFREVGGWEPKMEHHGCHHPPHHDRTFGCREAVAYSFNSAPLSSGKGLRPLIPERGEQAGHRQCRARVDQSSAHSSLASVSCCCLNEADFLQSAWSADSAQFSDRLRARRRRAACRVTLRWSLRVVSLVF
jgi:hypothetical protein